MRAPSPSQVATDKIAVMLTKAILACLLFTTIVNARSPLRQVDSGSVDGNEDSAEVKFKKKFDDMTRDNLKAILSSYKNWTATNSNDQPFIEAVVKVVRKQHMQHVNQWKQFHEKKKALANKNASGNDGLGPRNIFNNLAENLKDVLGSLFGGQNSAKKQSDQEKKPKKNDHSFPVDEKFDFQGELNNVLSANNEDSNQEE
ncbi:hypothetical protein Btru_015456 [Bulinus truncatus]|nr:hypothetical protein Btru_015456 [Bulinus truncatus]